MDQLTTLPLNIWNNIVCELDAIGLVALRGTCRKCAFGRLSEEAFERWAIDAFKIIYNDRFDNRGGLLTIDKRDALEKDFGYCTKLVSVCIFKRLTKIEMYARTKHASSRTYIQKIYDAFLDPRNGLFVSIPDTNELWTNIMLFDDCY